MIKAELIKLQYQNALFPSKKTSMLILSEYIKEIFESDKFITNDETYFAAFYRFSFLVDQLTDVEIRNQIIKEIGFNPNVFNTEKSEKWFPEIYGWEKVPSQSDLDILQDTLIVPCYRAWEFSEFNYRKSILKGTDVINYINEKFPRIFSPQLLKDRNTPKKLYRFLTVWFIRSMMMTTSRLRMPVFDLDFEDVKGRVDRKIDDILNIPNFRLNFNMNMVFEILVDLLKSDHPWFRKLDFDPKSWKLNIYHPYFKLKTFQCLALILQVSATRPESLIPLDTKKLNTKNYQKYEIIIDQNKKIVEKHIRDVDNNLILQMLQQRLSNIGRNIFIYQEKMMQVINNFYSKTKTLEIFREDMLGTEGKELLQQSLYVGPEREIMSLNFENLKRVIEKIYTPEKKGLLTYGEIETDLNSATKQIGNLKISHNEKNPKAKNPFMLLSSKENAIYIVDFKAMVINMNIIGDKKIAYHDSFLYKILQKQAPPISPRLADDVTIFDKAVDYKIILFYLQMYMVGILHSGVIRNIISAFDLNEWILRLEDNMYKDKYFQTFPSYKYK